MVDFLGVVGNLLLFSLVFGMSATVDIECMREQARNKKAIFIGCACQFLVLPLLGFLVVNLFDLSPELGITLLVVTSSPGGSYSNWWCSVFNADLALSVTMTAVSTILSICILPINLLLYTKYSYEADILHNLDWPSLFFALLIVISAIGLGLYCSYKNKSHEFNGRANQLGNYSGLALIIFSATVTNMGDSDSRIWARDWNFYVAVSGPCIAGLVLANIIATYYDLKPPERVTVAVECCYQNVGIATSLALTMFDGDDRNEALGVPFFYGIVEMFFIGTYCVGAWKAGWTKAPANAPFWNVIITSYEVIQAKKRELCEVEVSYSESDVLQDDERSEDGRVLTHYFNASASTLKLPTPDEIKDLGQLA